MSEGDTNHWGEVPASASNADRAAAAMRDISNFMNARRRVITPSTTDGLVPDEIDIFRALRGAGRSDRAKMQAINDLLEPVRKALGAPS